MKKIFAMLFILMSFNVFAQKTQIALLKYRGGGDWYSNPTSLPNLVKFCNQSIQTDLNPDIATVDVGSPDIFNYPFVHMTGHGNVVFDDAETENLRNYLLAGGFLHIDDNYGIKDYAMSQMQKVFPELVYERGGQLSINYIELIPLLILEVQKLSAEVEVLQKRIDGK